MSDAALPDLDFDQWSEQSVHFFSREVPKLLADALRRVGSQARLVDVGCGDGHLVWALAQNGHVRPGSRVTGIDISPIRLRRFRALTGFDGLVAESHLLPELATGGTDLAISTMVIEHVPDDRGHVKELARIVRPGGRIYLSTVIRKRGAWYFRKAPDGRRVLDPTHLREYASADLVRRLVESQGFVIEQERLSRLVFPIAHPLVRWWHARRPIADVQRFFLEPKAAWLEALALPIPRYRSIEIVARRAGDAA